jgi:hypothetical protein
VGGAAASVAGSGVTGASAMRRFVTP